MRSAIIIAAVFLVNAAAWSANANKANTSLLVTWLQQTGKDRTDYDTENATLVDRKPGNGKSKARGAPATNESDADRFLHLFSKSNNKPDFIVVEHVEREGQEVKDWVFKLNLSGKLLKTVLARYAVDANGMEDVSHGSLDTIKAGKSEKALLDSDLAFWLARAKQDSKPEEAKPNGEAKP